MTDFGDARPEEVGSTLLLGLVRVADTTGASITVTVSVHGVVFTGLLIGFREYIRKYGDQLAQGFDQHSFAAGHSIRQSVGARADEVDLVPGEEIPSTSRYMHMAQVRMVAGAILLPSGPTAPLWPLWRIRLDAVDAFSLGTFTVGAVP